jgi:hypothetical protein
LALSKAGEGARAAWSARDFDALVAGGVRIQLQLPGADPSAAVGQAQAVALLRAYVRGTVEVGLRVENAREVGPDRAFVELSRRYRAEGTDEVREEGILLGYRWSRGEGGWRLADLRVVPHP